MSTMGPLDTRSYLLAPHVAQLATVRPDKRPHLAPVWFKWEEKKAYVMCKRNSIKVRNIQLNPAITLSVANNERPYKYVVLEGTAQITKGDVEQIVHNICTHYEGPEDGKAYAQKLLSHMDLVLIEITVLRTSGWIDESS